MSNDEVDDIIKDVDSDSSGFMKYEEFVKERLEKLKK
jgi:Ca2+-binding EF-hand superfamily protein